MKFSGAIQLDNAEDYTFINNSIAGSEKAGLKFKGVPCEDMNAVNRIYGNEVKRWFCCCYYCCYRFINIAVVVFALKMLLMFHSCCLRSSCGCSYLMVVKLYCILLYPVDQVVLYTYIVSLRMFLNKHTLRKKCPWKIWIRITLNMDTFHAVTVTRIIYI